MPKDQEIKHLCREYTKPRHGIRVNEKFGPVLNIKNWHPEDRKSIEVQVPSLFGDQTVSLVGIVHGVDTYVTESMLTTKEDYIASGRPIAEARPRQKPAVTSTSVSIPVHERKWIDIETPRLNDQKLVSVKSRYPTATA